PKPSVGAVAVPEPIDVDHLDEPAPAASAQPAPTHEGGDGPAATTANEAAAGGDAGRPAGDQRSQGGAPGHVEAAAGHADVIADQTEAASGHRQASPGRVEEAGTHDPALAPGQPAPPGRPSPFAARADWGDAWAEQALPEDETPTSGTALGPE